MAKISFQCACGHYIINMEENSQITCPNCKQVYSLSGAFEDGSEGNTGEEEVNF